MYEELVKRLKAHNGWVLNETLDEAADAIEELSKLADAVPHVCECCIGCELEKKNGGCDNAFVLSPKRAMQYLIKPRWIPMTERLPKDKQNCLCHGKYGGIRVLCFAKNLRQIDKYDFADKRRPGWFYNDSEWGYCEAIGITHWMPLPTPPKEEET